MYVFNSLGSYEFRLHYPQASLDLTGVPPNTLLVTLSPPGITYYLSSTTPASPPSPTCGYSSDSEFSSKRAERDGHTPGGLPVIVPWGAPTKELSPHSGRHLMSDGASTPKHTVHTTAYQQLFESVLSIFFECTPFRVDTLIGL